MKVDIFYRYTTNSRKIFGAEIIVCELLNNPILTNPFLKVIIDKVKSANLWRQLHPCPLLKVCKKIPLESLLLNFLLERSLLFQHDQRARIWTAIASRGIFSQNFVREPCKRKHNSTCSQKYGQIRLWKIILKENPIQL